ncbi:hypothetical protein K440DRAFT_618012 [Wilcoxina mikolae CBS 423.85]|nr:hypothetical protein K440DRAFT_618012 [Wilcoxina mikolae CBS 423.85]
MGGGKEEDTGQQLESTARKNKKKLDPENEGDVEKSLEEEAEPQQLLGSTTTRKKKMMKKKRDLEREPHGSDDEEGREVQTLAEIGNIPREMVGEEGRKKKRSKRKRKEEEEEEQQTPIQITEPRAGNSLFASPPAEEPRKTKNRKKKRKREEEEEEEEAEQHPEVQTQNTKLPESEPAEPTAGGSLFAYLAPEKPRKVKKKRKRRQEEDVVIPETSALEAIPAPEIELQPASESERKVGKSLFASQPPEQPRKKRKKRKREEEVPLEEVEQQPEVRPEQTQNAKPPASDSLFASPPPERHRKTKKKRKHQEEGVTPETAALEAIPSPERPGSEFEPKVDKSLVNPALLPETAPLEAHSTSELELHPGSEPVQTPIVESEPTADTLLLASPPPEKPKKTKKKRRREKEVNFASTATESEQEPEDRSAQSQTAESEFTTDKSLFASEQLKRNSRKEVNRVSPPPETVAEPEKKPENRPVQSQIVESEPTADESLSQLPKTPVPEVRTDRPLKKTKKRKKEVIPTPQPDATLFEASATPNLEQPEAEPTQTQNIKPSDPEPTADKSLFASPAPEQQVPDSPPVTNAGPKNKAKTNYSDWENSKPRTRCNSEPIWGQSTEDEEGGEETERDGSFYTTKVSSSISPIKPVSKAEETPREVPPLPGEGLPSPADRAESPSLFDEDVPWAEIRTRESSPAGDGAVLGLSQIMGMCSALPSKLPSVLPEDIEGLADIFGSDAEVAAELEAEQDQTVVRDNDIHSTQSEEDEVDLPPLPQKSPSKKRSKKIKPSRKEVKWEDTEEKISSQPIARSSTPAPLNAGKERLVEMIAKEETKEATPAAEGEAAEVSAQDQTQAPTPTLPAPAHYVQTHSYTSAPTKTLTDYFRPVPRPTTFSVVIPVPPRPPQDPESGVNPDYILVLFLSGKLPADWKDTTQAAMKDLDAAIKQCCVSNAEVVAREGKKAQMAIVCRGKENAFRLVQNTMWRRPLEEVLGICGRELEDYVVKSQVE